MTETPNSANESADSAPRPSSLRETANMVMILCGSIYTGLLTVALAPIMPQLRDHYGGAYFAQFILVVAAAGVVAAGPFAGAAVDKYGPRKVLLVCTLIYSAIGVSGIFIENVYVLIVARFILGAMASSIYCSTFTLAGDLYDGHKRAKLFGYKGAVGSGCATISVIIAGHIAMDWGWQMTYILYLAAIPMFLLALGLKETPRVRLAQQPGSASGGLSVWTMWPFFLLLTMLFSAGFSSHVQGAFLLEIHGVTRPDVAAPIIACASFSMMFGSASYGHITKHFGYQSTFRTGVGLLGFGAIVVALAENPYLIAAGFILYGIGNGLNQPYLHNLILERAPPEIRGRASGFVSPTHYAGEFVNPACFAVLTMFGGLPGAFLSMGIMLIISAFVLRPDLWRIKGTLDCPKRD